MKQKYTYVMINILVYLITVIIFYSEITDHYTEFNYLSLLAVTIGTAIFVYIIKALRMYIILYGADISFAKHMEQYFRTVPASLLLPFKMGDIFRAYCYGYQMKNYLKGIIVILMDRFVDSLALLSMIFIINSISGTNYSLIFYLLVAFLIFVMACYLLFPPIYRYWNKYFIKNVASARKNTCLKILSRMEHTYEEIYAMVKGRFAVLYILSFAAWVIEIGRIALFTKVFSHTGTMQASSEYLLSALYKTKSVYLKQFIYVGVVIALIGYLIVWYLKFTSEKNGVER